MSLEATVTATGNGPVEFHVSVENTDDQPIELRFSTGQRVDVIVYDEETGERVWQWSDDRMFTMALQEVTVDPGGTITETLRWEDPPRGAYRARSTLEADPNVAAETAFTVD